MQPLHATSDWQIADRHWGDRSRNAYALKSIRLMGTFMAFGSDAPVESPNPFLGLHAAVTRTRTDGSPSIEGWYPQQKLNLTEALEGFTLGAAYAGHFENEIGQLAPGFLADFVVLDQDPFEMPPTDLWRVSPSGVVVAGDWVWRS
jgi:predicted amidohydrolase YtcJ